jgi:DNA polymerase-3 subunit gamma/tau
MIARAAEGSARDGLSLLDQAIAHGGGAVMAEAVRSMLGLADRARIVDLFQHVVKGDVAAALGEFAGQYEAGAKPGCRGAHRSCRFHPSGDPAEICAGCRQRSSR